MTARLSAIGVSIVVMAAVALRLGWRRGNPVLAIVGALVLAMAAFNVALLRDRKTLNMSSEGTATTHPNRDGPSANRAHPQSTQARHVVAILVVLFSAACDQSNLMRPASVPAGATRVAFSKDGGWAHCWLDLAVMVNRCRTYNAGGERLFQPGHESDDDDVFLRDDGGTPLSDGELLISPFRTSPGHIWLENGVVLISRNVFSVNKDLVDQIKAAMRSNADRDKPNR